MDDKLYNTLKKTWKLLQENVSIQYGYHYTNKKNLENIKINGLKINSNLGFTQEDRDFIKDAYGMIPLFFSTTPTDVYKTNDSVLLKVDVRGKRIGADLGTLIDYGVIIDEESFYFSIPNLIKGYEKYLNKDISYKKLYNNNGFIQDMIKLTGTFVVMEDIIPSSIIVL